jgi:hypothetical protein
MPFRKFRPLRQWGRYNTKIFKNILIARNKRVVEPYSDPDFIKDMGATVYNPLEPDFFKQFEESATPPKYSSPENFFQQSHEVCLLNYQNYNFFSFNLDASIV